MTFCDFCGDLTKAWKPIELRFPDRSTLTINVCLECWRDFEKSSRKVKVAKMLSVLMR